MSDGTTDACRVVICDDVPAFRKLLCILIGLEEGFEVVGEAGNGLEAIETSRREQPDVVVLDVAMPEMDGIEALPLIRDAAPAAQVLMLSGFASDDIKARARAAGAWRFLEKGVAPQEIVDTVRAACACPAVA